MNGTLDGRVPERCEKRRLAALRAYRVLDSPREEEFDKLVALACKIFSMPMAAISFVETERQWFKAEVGLGCDETPIDCSICYHAVVDDADLFVVRDTLADRRIACNPLVTGAPGLRFYAGAALRTPEGYSLGTLLLLDTKPNDITSTQGELLKTLARQVMLMLETRRVSQGRLALSESLQSDIDLRRDVLSIVSHDLRSPLSTISMVAQMSGEMAAKMDGGQQLVEMNRILMSSADDMLRLIDDLSDYSRVDQERMVMRFTPMLVAHLMDGISDRFRLPVEKKGLAFSITKSEGVPELIVADQHRLVQAVGNLVSNALDFTPPGGSVSVDISDQDDRLEISVANTGAGIAPENLGRIFDRFWTGRRNSGGANRGLGLAIVKNIAEAHQGSVSVTSADGMTTFIISLAAGLREPGGEQMLLD